MFKKDDMKKMLFIVMVISLAYWIVTNYEVVLNIISIGFNVIFPFILGFAIAFILNIPMSKIENFLKKQFKKKHSKIPIRIISICLSLLILIGIISLLLFLLIPELVQNIQLLINNIPTIISNIEIWFLDLLSKYPEIQIKLQEAFNQSSNFSNVIGDILNYIANGAIGIIGNIISGFITFFTALIFSIYMLSQKEYLLDMTKKVVYAYQDKRKADKLMELGKLANKTFNSFISGQCVDAVVLGTIIFIVCSLFRFPYALIIAVLTTVTALIPVLGAMIAMVIGAILIATINPFQALLFIAIFLVVQQIEGNFIYPKIVGKSVGLSPMWTLLAISVGGSLFGIVGMLVSLPLASIAYTILKTDVNKKLKDKNFS